MRALKTTEAFYHNLGKLFYAIAFADKSIEPSEFKQLQRCVKKYWLDYDDLEDVFASDAAYLIEIVFEGAQYRVDSAQEMFEAFVAYKREQPHLFTDQAKKLILDTAEKIARSFAGLNKSELVMLAKLRLELSK